MGGCFFSDGEKQLLSSETREVEMILHFHQCAFKLAEVSMTVHCMTEYVPEKLKLCKG